MEELISVEERIKQGFVDQVLGFKDIADGHLYKAAGYKNFDDYCEERANCGARRGWQLVKAGNVVRKLIDAGTEWLPSNEAQARELARLRPPKDSPDNEPDVANAAQIIVDYAPKKNGEPQVTAKGMRETLIAKKVVPPPPQRSEEQKKAAEYNRQLRAQHSAYRSVATLKGEMSAKTAYRKFGEELFTTDYEEALAYLLELEELRNG